MLINLKLSTKGHKNSWRPKNALLHNFCFKDEVKNNKSSEYQTRCIAEMIERSKFISQITFIKK